MSKDEKCTCKACKTTVFHCQICKFVTFLLPSSSWLLKFPKNAKRERGQYPAILTELVWSIKDLLYGIKSTEKMIFVLVYFRALKRKPVIRRSDDALRFSRFLFPSRQINHRKSFHCHGKYLAKENFRLPVGLRRNVIAGTKRAIPTRQYRFILPARVANQDTEFAAYCPLAELAI